MSKHWNPGRKTVALKSAQPVMRPSRIRRDPVRLSESPDVQRKLEPPSREEELYGGIIGIVLFAAALTIAILGIAAAGWFNEDPAAEAEARHFGQCYNGFGPNCVFDGGTARIASETVAIAGLEAPRINDAACDEERDSGIAAAVKLAELLNSGPVTVGPTFRDEDGRAVRAVKVNGNDVGDALVKSGLASGVGKPANWCRPSSVAAE